jgi:hypothetical protein
VGDEAIPISQIAIALRSASVGPLPQVAREVLGADPMMGADQPGFDVAEQRVDDREEFAGIGFRDTDSLPTDSVQFALSERAARSSIRSSSSRYGTRGRQILCHDDLAPDYAAALASHRIRRRCSSDSDRLRNCSIACGNAPSE